MFSPLFPSQGGSQGMGDFLPVALCQAGYREGHGHTKIPKMFLLLLMESLLGYALAWVLQRLNWFLEFSQRYSGPHIVVKLVSPLGNKGLERPHLPSWWYFPDQPFLKPCGFLLQSGVTLGLLFVVISGLLFLILLDQIQCLLDPMPLSLLISPLFFVCISSSNL